MRAVILAAIVILAMIAAACDTFVEPDSADSQDSAAPVSETCSPPYKVIAGLCCLDEDDNGMCDAFEEEEPEPECPDGQVKIGMVCCVDDNENEVCDNSEAPQEPEPTPEPEPESESSRAEDEDQDLPDPETLIPKDPEPEITEFVKVDNKLVVDTADAKGLQDFPEMFLSYKMGRTGNHFNGLIVVGEQAPSRDVLSAAELTKLFVRIAKDDVITAYMDSEVEDIKAQNAIIIGRPCENTHSATLLGTTQCSAGLSQGDAKLKFFKHGEFVQIVAYGYDSIATAAAVEDLVNYKQSGIFGKDWRVI